MNKLKFLVIAAIFIYPIQTLSATLNQAEGVVKLITTTESDEGVIRIVKKGDLGQFTQHLSSGTHARTFRNIHVTAVRTISESRKREDKVKIYIQFDVQAHGWCTVGSNKGVDYAAMRDAQTIERYSKGRMTPFDYPNRWYTISHEVNPPGVDANHDFEAMNAFKVIANQDTVQSC